MPQSEWRGLRNPWTPSLESFMEEGGLLPGVFLFTPQVCLASPPSQWFCIMESEEHMNGR